MLEKLRDGRVVGWALVAVLAGGLGAGAVALSANGSPEPAAQVESVEAIDYAAMPFTNGLAGEQETDAAAAVAAEQARTAAEQAAAAEAARVAAEQAAAAAEAERVAAEHAEADPEAQEDPPAQATGPTKCPAGSLPNSGDGENHTSCFPEECFHVTLPDPAYPQCVTAFKP